jgi:hypothetical protein
MRIAVLTAFSVVMVGCGVGEPTPSERRVDGLVGGTVDDGGFPEVVFMALTFSSDAGPPIYRRCSGTLITPTVVLTAAHCTSQLPAPAGTVLTAIGVQNASPAPAPGGPGWAPTTTWRAHPSWNTSVTNAFDIGLVKLAAPLPNARTRPYTRRPLVTADIGRPMTVLGFGITSANGMDPGIRRHVQLPLRGLQPALIELGDFTTAGICPGDSGGPSILTEADGVGRVIGVHSRTVPGANCMDGVDTRVDVYGTFIRQFLMDTGGPSCVEDGLCASGCASPDPDCVCGGDGVCNAQCPNLLSDPDCPRDCVANGVCATDACPRPDPDCTAELSACTMDSQCQYRTCATDPQRMQRYCSRPCSATCGTGTQCSGTVCLQPQLPTAALGAPCTLGGTFCLSGTCTGRVGGATTCRATCTTDAQCASTDECVDGQTSVRVCERKPPEAMPGEACQPMVTRCLGGTTCTGLPGGPTTCRATCMTDAQCVATDECVMGSSTVRICVMRAPPVAAGQPCMPGVTRCENGTACTGLPMGATTCRATCTTDAQCATTQECVTGQGSLRICEPRPPEASEGGACTIGVTRCLGGTTCTGLMGQPTTCRETCVLDTQCDTTHFCARAQNDVSVCAPQPIFVEPIVVAESQAPKTGCSSTLLSPLLLGLLLWARRRR